MEISIKKKVKKNKTIRKKERIEQYENK